MKQLKKAFNVIKEMFTRQREIIRIAEPEKVKSGEISYEAKRGMVMLISCEEVDAFRNKIKRLERERDVAERTIDLLVDEVVEAIWCDSVRHHDDCFSDCREVAGKGKAIKCVKRHFKQQAEEQLKCE